MCLRWVEQVIELQPPNISLLGRDSTAPCSKKKYVCTSATACGRTHISNQCSSLSPIWHPRLWPGKHTFQGTTPCQHPTEKTGSVVKLDRCGDSSYVCGTASLFRSYLWGIRCSCQRSSVARAVNLEWNCLSVGCVSHLGYRLTNLERSCLHFHGHVPIGADLDSGPNYSLHAGHVHLAKMTTIAPLVSAGIPAPVVHALHSLPLHQTVVKLHSTSCKCAYPCKVVVRRRTPANGCSTGGYVQA